MAKRKRPPARLKMYAAYVNYPHIRWRGWHEYRADQSGFAIDRIAFPLVASSLRQAKILAEEAWGSRGRTGRVMVRYIGPCVEPKGR